MGEGLPHEDGDEVSTGESRDGVLLRQGGRLVYEHKVDIILLAAFVSERIYKRVASPESGRAALDSVLASPVKARDDLLRTNWLNT